MNTYDKWSRYLKNSSVPHQTISHGFPWKLSCGLKFFIPVSGLCSAQRNWLKSIHVSGLCADFQHVYLSRHVFFITQAEGADILCSNTVHCMVKCWSSPAEHLERCSNPFKGVCGPSKIRENLEFNNYLSKFCTTIILFRPVHILQVNKT